MMRKLAVSLGLVLSVWLAVHHLRAPRIPPEALLGLWSQFDGTAPTDEMRFYYFHQGGKGLYRYGQVGYNQTHSFDWSIDGNELRLVFRKTGEQATSVIELSGSGKGRTLLLRNDPRGARAGDAVRYTERKSQLDSAGPLTLSADGADRGADPGSIDGNLWVDLEQYATGGAGFVMYQLSRHDCPTASVDDALAGRAKLGWHHRGDFDDWSTEALCYRSAATSLALAFTVRGDKASTSFTLGRDATQRRELTLARDPRNFFHRTSLADRGPSF